VWRINIYERKLANGEMKTARLHEWRRGSSENRLRIFDTMAAMSATQWQWRKRLKANAESG